MQSSIVRHKLTILALGIAVSLTGVGLAQSPGREILNPQQIKGVTPPKLITSVDPTYPRPKDKSEKLHAGIARVYLIVDAEGIPKDLRIDESSGFDDLDQAALAAVQRYRFQPATKDGTPFSVPLRVVVNFKTMDPGDLVALEPVSMLEDSQNPPAGSATTPDITRNSNPSKVANFAVGGPVTPPVLIKSVQPKYPHRGVMGSKSHSGSVKVYTIVDTDGLPQNVRVARSSEFDELDQAAVEAVKQYRFKPAKKDGQAVNVDLYIEVNFQLY